MGGSDGGKLNNRENYTPASYTVYKYVGRALRVRIGKRSFHDVP